MNPPLRTESDRQALVAALLSVVLFATLVHIVFLAAFFARWIGIEPEVPDRPVRTRAARGARGTKASSSKR